PSEASVAATARALRERLRTLPQGWLPIFEADGVCAFHAGLGAGASKTVLLGDGAGAVFGRIFNRDLGETAGVLQVDPEPAESLRIVQTGGRRLIERYWGRYVALIRDPATGEAWILRDPTGAMPCLMMSFQGLNLIFSD